MELASLLGIGPLVYTACMRARIHNKRTGIYVGEESTHEYKAQHACMPRAQACMPVLMLCMPACLYAEYKAQHACMPMLCTEHAIQACMLCTACLYAETYYTHLNILRADTCALIRNEIAQRRNTNL